ncbi:MAG: zinc ribbon domain-containing protein [Gammaproteobacteria bacterium]|nr:zinc ribbon domain-containing protein [Gammaproteobacteria bacterium]
MPIFDYRCKQCGHSFDALQKLGEAPLRECPECGKAALEKLVSAPALQVKGGAGRSSTAGHSHSHGGHTHSHGPGCGHKH